MTASYVGVVLHRPTWAALRGSIQEKVNHRFTTSTSGIINPKWETHSSISSLRHASYSRKDNISFEEFLRNCGLSAKAASDIAYARDVRRECRAYWFRSYVQRYGSAWRVESVPRAKTFGQVQEIWYRDPTDIAWHEYKWTEEEAS